MFAINGLRLARHAAAIAAMVALVVVGAARADEWEPAKTRAVIVGVLEWKSGLTPYSKRHRKDQELRDVLVARGTPAENIELLLDKDATLPKIREAIARTARKAETDSTGQRPAG
jgi:chromatin segregation and condensation protein Rec8/ScpA/Scc1 (kleisin family)